MNRHRVLLSAVILATTTVVVLLVADHAQRLLTIPALACVALAVLVPVTAPAPRPASERTKRKTRRLATGSQLQRGVFEASADLVHCLRPAEAEVAFAATIRTWWRCQGVVVVWRRGDDAWQPLGEGPVVEVPPEIAPVVLPQVTGDDLVLDISTEDGIEARIIARDASAQGPLAFGERADQVAVAEILRGQFSLTLRRVLLFADMEQLARTDQLTGTCRRWYGQERLAELLAGDLPVAIALLDIDHFKQVNDRFGHLVGDRVLAAVGQALVGGLRANDLVMRYGGEEFVILLVDTDLERAALVLERLLAAIRTAEVPCCQVTASAGLTTANPGEAQEAALARADEACYRAKALGGDRLATGPA